MSKYQYIIDAIKKLYNDKVIRSYTEMAQKMNVSKQYISQIIGGHANPSDEFIKSLSENYPYIKQDLFEGHAEAFPGRLEAHEEIIKYNAKSQSNTYKRMIPVVHYRAQAGFSEGWSDQEWIDDLPTVEVEWPKDGNYLAFEVTGDSMECDCKKNISDRDIVIAREVARHHWVNKLHIPDTFVIVQRMDGILVKEIIKHDVARGVITCHSNNALFPDFGLSLEDVEKLYHVKEVRRRW